MDYIDDAENMTRLSVEVEEKVGDYSLEDVSKVTPRIVKEAASKHKPGKSDPVFSFSSDCIKID